MTKRCTAVIQREGDGFVALCPELDLASQGDTIESARENLREALSLFFECASPDEIYHGEPARLSSGKRSFLGNGVRVCCSGVVSNEEGSPPQTAPPN